jgi:poly-beta-1,6-N-acetyl-D-glucosamine synthase
MRIVTIVSFLDEERHLPRLLASLASQTRFPDELLLVDDGSSDASGRIAEEFAADRDGVRVLRRPPHPAGRDRLAGAHELLAFQWALAQATPGWDVVAKVDADLEFTPRSFEFIEQAFERDAALGMAGAYLSAAADDGTLRREPQRVEHVRGPNKFYRRQCYEEIGPLPAHLGWDTMDQIRAAMRGWRTASLEMPDGEVVHLRPVGSHDGRLRAWRRWGTCAWGYGEHPLHVLALAARRAGERPRVLGALNYVVGWGVAGLRRAPRAEPELRAYVRREQMQRMRARLRRTPSRAAAERG